MTGVSFRKRFSASLSITKLVTPGSVTSVLSPGSGSGRAGPAPGEQHTLVDMGAVAKEETKAKMEKAYEGRDKRGLRPNVKRTASKKGICGEYDREGKYQKCGMPGLPQRSNLFCQQCRRYFHLPCFFAAHACTFMK